jgi:hypothetical protein
MPVTIKYAPALEAGTYDATVTDVEEKVSLKTGGSYHRWEFTIEDGRTISALTGMSFGPTAKAGKWTAALLGRVPELGEEVELVGMSCIIQVGLDEEGRSEVISLLGRPKTTKSPVKPLTDAQNAEQQHAIQEGDELPF